VIHTTELLVPDPCLFEVEIAIATLKRYKSPGSDQILAEQIQAGGETMRSEIHELINSIWNKEELPDQWKESNIVPIYKKGDKIMVVIIIKEYQCYQLYTTFFSNILLRLSPCVDKIVADNQCGI
jgi:hypothetical protein